MQEHEYLTVNVYFKSVTNSQRWECLLKTPIIVVVSTMKIFARPVEYKKITGETYSKVKEIRRKKGLLLVSKTPGSSFAEPSPARGDKFRNASPD